MDVTLARGVEAAFIMGMGLSCPLQPRRPSRPHVAVPGRIPGTTQVLDLRRHDVVTDPGIVLLRLGASLRFPTVRFLEDVIDDGAALGVALDPGRLGA